MSNEKLIHDLIVEHLKEKLKKDYKEIKFNSSGNPDLSLSNHGMLLANVEVETDSSINLQKTADWKEMIQSGTKLILIVPKNVKFKVTELLWQNNMTEKISVGTYEISINMP
ncbi:MAG: hypothetical protein LLF28_07945 [Nitrospiraceae bacterium]|nr:hypothetical protein [Nitrospiraceae bacterium]